MTSSWWHTLLVTSGTRDDPVTTLWRLPRTTSSSPLGLVQVSLVVPTNRYPSPRGTPKIKLREETSYCTKPRQSGGFRVQRDIRGHNFHPGPSSANLVRSRRTPSRRTTTRTLSLASALDQQILAHSGRGWERRRTSERGTEGATGFRRTPEGYEGHVGHLGTWLSWRREIVNGSEPTKKYRHTLT